MLIDTFKHKGLRKNLVKELEKKGIKDTKVLAAIGTIPRHVYFDTALIDHAYVDKAFPIGEGQTISQPFTVARQTELLEVKKGEKILEIGTGSGYQCAVLLELGAEVHTIEYHQKLYEKTKIKMEKIGYKANFLQGDGSRGVKKYAPYAKILATAACKDMVSVMMEQLQIGGIGVYPENRGATEVLVKIIKKSATEYDKLDYDKCKFVPMLGEYGLN